MESNYYRGLVYCVVPTCQNSKLAVPNKSFINCPAKNEKWLDAINGHLDHDQKLLEISRENHVCEDHFKLEDDAWNYADWRLNGTPINLKYDVVPHVFGKPGEQLRDTKDNLIWLDKQIEYSTTKADMKTKHVTNMVVARAVHEDLNTVPPSLAYIAEKAIAEMAVPKVAVSDVNHFPPIQNDQKCGGWLLNINEETKQLEIASILSSESTSGMGYLNAAVTQNESSLSNILNKETKHKVTQTLISVLCNIDDQVEFSHIIIAKKTNFRRVTRGSRASKRISALLPRTKSVQVNINMPKSTIWPYPVLASELHNDVCNADVERASFFNEWISYLNGSSPKSNTLVSMRNCKIVPVTVKNDKFNILDFSECSHLGHATTNKNLTTQNPTLSTTVLAVEPRTTNIKYRKKPTVINESTYVIDAFTDPGIKTDEDSSSIYNNNSNRAEIEVSRVIESEAKSQSTENTVTETFSKFAALDTSNSTEIDKFKRRMIRAVARLRQKNTPEDDLWQEMKNETGCDCQLLWERMRSLTIKKLKRLLNGEDRVDAVPKAARMSVTDWLLFDLVLVHEKIDVIGQDSARFGKRGELKALVDLFSLAQRFGVEGPNNEDLAEKWYNATVHYNSGGHHVSPMLLQLRWHQLKEVTRKVFYDFWYTYRGNARLFDEATKQHTPTALQMMMAKRFSSIVTKPFEEWKDKIKKGLVIVSEQFEELIRKKKSTPLSIDENTPELEVIEPVIETIDLEADSDAEKDKRKDADASAQETVEVKLELTEVDEDDSCYATETNPQEYLNAAEQELDAIDSADGNDEEIDASSSDAHNEDSLTAPDEGDQLSVDSVVRTEPPLETLDEPPVEDTEPLPLITNVYGNVELTSESISIIGALAADISDSVDKMSRNSDVSEPVSVKSIQSNIDLSSIQINDSEKDTFKPTIVKIEEDDNGGDLEANENTLPVAPGLAEENVVTTDSVADIVDKTCEEALQKLKEVLGQDSVRQKVNYSSFVKQTNDLHLVDDDIQFVDDGIAYVDEDMDDGDAVDKIKREQDEGDTANGESAKIDLKLLLYPVVYTTNLDHMGLVDFDAYQTVKDKNLIDDISAKSKPVSNKTVNLDNIKKEEENCEYISDDDDYSENIITDVHKVKITSNLLQKPRTRAYNPIMLCKNPDFNTRLKRINVGFFSYQRNILLLKQCKPLTVDVSKAFESKLMNGTIYLKPNDTEPQCELNSKHMDLQKDSVFPSAMPVQSLIDNQSVSVEPALAFSDTTNSTVSNFSKSPIVYDKPTKPDIPIERRRGINLPDISEIRRINQQLLIAEVTPIQVQNIGNQSNVGQSNIQQSSPNNSNVTMEHITVQKPPENNPNRIEQLNALQSSVTSDKPVVKPANNRTITAPFIYLDDDTNACNKSIEPIQKPSMMPTAVVDLASTDTTTEASRLKQARRQAKQQLRMMSKPTNAWYSRESRPNISWLSRKFIVRPSAEVRTAAEDEALLTADSLSKMLFLLSCENEQKEEFFKSQLKNTNKGVKKKKRDGCNSDKTKQLKTKPQIRVHKAIEPNKLPTELTTETIQVTPESADSTQKETPESADSTQKETPESADSTQKEKICKPKIMIVATKTQTRRKKCCWAAAKIDQLKCRRKRVNYQHDCLLYLRGCFCCCRELLKEYASNLAKENNADIAIKNVLQEIHIPDDSSGCDCIETDCRQLIHKVSKQTANSSNSGHVIDLNEDTDCNVDLNSKEPPVGAEVSVDSEIEESHPSNPVACPHNSTPNKILARINIKIPPPTQTLVPAQTPSPAEATITSSRPQLLRTPPLPLPSSNVPQRPPFRVTSDRPKLLKPIITSPVCKCEPKLNLNTIKRKIIIDGSTSCPLHKNIFARFNAEKKIYINSKQLSDKASDNPIFLGKNKILLTNVKFPPHIRNKDYNNRPPTAKIIPVMPLPPGVQLVLQPNGELTCTVDPNLTLDEEQLQLLPGIIEAVKKQLCATSLTANESPTIDISQTDEVVNLCDDGTNEILENADKIQSVIAQPDNERTSSSESSQIKPDTSNVDSSLSVTEETTDREQHSENTTGIIITDKCDENTINCDKSDNNITSTNKEITENDKNVITDNNKTALETSEIISKDIDNIEQPAESSECNVDANLPSESKAGEDKSKNILSDLMEMSGISAEDATPAPVETVKPNMSTEPPSQVPLSISSMPSFAELTPITSFHELKYACSKNGAFFKLDFESGVIAPINVCIKKKGNTGNTKKMDMIDLTEEDEAAPEHVNMLNLIASNNEYRSQSPTPVKPIRPIRLFKTVPTIMNKLIKLKKRIGDGSVISSPSILKKRVTVLDGRLLKATVLSADSQITNPKADDKENCSKQVAATIDMVDSDCPMEEEYLENIDSDDEGVSRKRKPDPDDSSDDEPLSKVAKKIREVENETTKDVNKGPEDEVTPSTSNTLDDESSDVVATNDDCLDISMKPFNVEVLFDQSDESGGEDCILGF